MASYNRVILMGNLTRDPEVRATPSGTPVAEMRLAVSETYRKKDSGESVEVTCFVDVVAWGRQAETCGEYLSKGRPILVEGRLQYDEWQTPQNEKRSKLRVRADRVQFLSAPRRAEYQDGPEGAARTRTDTPAADKPPAASADRNFAEGDRAGKNEEGPVFDGAGEGRDVDEDEDDLPF